MKLEWKLRECLENHRLNGRTLALEAGIAPQAVYRIMKENGPDYLHRPTLEKLLTALNKLTGKEVTPNDLLELVEEPPPEPMDASTQGWLDGGLADTLEHLEALEQDSPEAQAWLASFQTTAQPVTFNPDRRAWTGKRKAGTR